MKKVVHSSHLACRFYKRDGWSEVHRFLTKGTVRDTEFTHHDAPANAYYALNVGSALDVDRLMEEVDHVVAWDGVRLVGQEAKRYIEEMNW